MESKAHAVGDGTGMGLIDLLAAQIGATTVWRTEGGMELTLTFAVAPDA